MTKLLDIAEFRRLARQGAAPKGAGIAALSARALGPLDDAERVIRFVFSDGSVDRVGDVIDPQGWEVADYRRNPIVLWAHDAVAPPIGRTVNLFVDHRGLVGDVEFAAPEVYGFADTIYRLVKEGYIRAGSVGFLPLEYTFSEDKNRPFGIDFHRQTLLEYSICPVPANPNALAEAQAKHLISEREANMLRARSFGTGDDDDAVAAYRRARVAAIASGDNDDGAAYRRARTAALAAPLRRRSHQDRLPPREVLLQRFAGPLVDRDHQVDLAYPGLARQELRDELAGVDRDTEAGRRAFTAAYRKYLDRAG